MPIQLNSLYPLGRISKTHGYNGTFVLIADQLLDDNLENLSEIFVMIDGLIVPFPVEELVLTGDTQAHVKLEFVNDQNEASGLVGCEVYTDITYHAPEIETGLEQWIGFTVHDTAYGNIGTIGQIEDYNGNIVLQVMDGDKETLISLFPELVTKIDDDLKILYITAPEGYFDEND